jgi:hypothetical protein
VLAPQHIAFQVHGDDRVEQTHVQVHNAEVTPVGVRRGEGGVAVQNRDRAELRADRCDYLPPSRLVGDVKFEAQGVTARVPDFGHHGLGRVRPDVRHRDCGALLRQRPGRGRSDAGARSGHERHLAVEPARHARPPR